MMAALLWEVVWTANSQAKSCEEGALLSEIYRHEQFWSKISPVGPSASVVGIVTPEAWPFKHPPFPAQTLI